ncbi:MAG: HNH endonuclease [Acidobacteria bacterium]|nr:HNH endonuclease [Acidobacteriota bacterium]
MAASAVYLHTDPNPYKFTGKERDAESGLDFFVARYYSSAYGRFLSPDEFTGGPEDAFSSSDPLPPGPLPYADITNLQSLNKYAYTFNNPVRYTDPNGHDGIEDFFTALDFVVGVFRGASASISFGAAPGSRPNESDSLTSRVGQTVGTAIVGGIGISATIGGVGTVAACSSSGAACAALPVVLPKAVAGTSAVVGAAKNSLDVILTPTQKSGQGPKKGSSGGPSAGKRVTPKQREQILQENDGKCVFCGKKATQVDHATPRSRNGNTKKENLQPACLGCNSSKGAKTSAEYIRWLKRKKIP